MPHLGAMGLGNIIPVSGVPPAPSPRASFGKLGCVSVGKDSTTGHWEIGGLIVETEFPTFPRGFPDGLMQRFMQATGVPGYLGNVPASGTAIIADLGDEHVRTGRPIVYTSADSVFQIAAHEEVIPLERLYDICRITRTRVCTGDDAVGRVIARPFLGSSGAYSRTTNRRDFSLPPSGDTVLDVLLGAGIPTTGIGKIEDLYAGSGLQAAIHTRNNAEGVAETVLAIRESRGGFVMTNLVDFDTLYGHRNDPRGFAAALEEFDRTLPAFDEVLRDEDILILTADHGNDPASLSTDHSREYVPLLWYSRAGASVPLGTRRSFADIGKSVAAVFGVENSLAGTSMLPLLRHRN